MKVTTLTAPHSTAEATNVHSLWVSYSLISISKADICISVCMRLCVGGYKCDRVLNGVFPIVLDLQLMHQS